MKEEIYISIRPEIYRRQKSNVLLSQADLLHSMKRLQNLRILSRQRIELKVELQKLLSSILGQIDSLKEKMPTPKVPKALQHHEERISSSQPKKAPNQKNMEIEEELLMINEKLRQLNS